MEGRDDEENEIEEETDLHHGLATVELIIDEEGGKVVTSEGCSNVDQTPQPSGHDIIAAPWGDNLDELRLEELVAVEENIITEPGAGGSDDTRAEVAKCELERLNIITGNVSLLLGFVELLRGEWHLVGSEVDKPQGTNGWDGERDTVSPLDGYQRVWWITASMVEDDQEENENDLVEELAPTLHQESHCDIATTVKTIILGGYTTSTNSVLHGCGGSHGVLSTNTDTVEEEGPGVADDPAVESNTP